MRARGFGLGAGLLLVACGPDDGATSDDPKENVIIAALRVLPADEDYRGKTLAQWAADYARWHYAWTSSQCMSAENDNDGSGCGLNQPEDSPVFFLGSSEAARVRDSVVERTLCKVPEDKAILVPISFFSENNAGVDEPRPPEELEDIVDEVHETMRELQLVADQVPVEELDQYSIGPTAYEVSVGDTPNWYSCNGYGDIANTTFNPSYFAGFFALVAPPTLGKHRLEYASVFSDALDRNSYFDVDTLFEVTEQE